MEKNLFDLDTNITENTDDLMDTEITEAEDSLPGNKDNYDETTNPGLPGNKDNYDETSIPTGGKEITAAEYNAAIASLQKSFKEAALVAETLSGLTVVPKTIDSIQDEYTESVIENAIYESFLTGPIYEAVERKDKDDVKDLVEDIITGFTRKVRKLTGVKYVKPNNVVRLLFAPGGKRYLISQAWTKRLWQIVGLIYVEEGNVQEVISTLNEEYKEQLGDYKFLASKCQVQTLIDTFHTKFGWNNVKECYTLLIDKKLPSEFKKAENESDAGDEKTDSKDEAPKEKEDKSNE